MEIIHSKRNYYNIQKYSNKNVFILLILILEFLEIIILDKLTVKN